MSLQNFDTVFDYSDAMYKMNLDISLYEQKVVDTNSLINMLSTMVGYSDITASQVQSLQDSNFRLITLINNINLIMLEMIAIGQIPNYHKQIIYAYSTYMKYDRTDMRMRLLFNHQSVLQNIAAATLINDTVNTQAQKNALANYIYSTYKITNLIDLDYLHTCVTFERPTTTATPTPTVTETATPTVTETATPTVTETPT